MEYYENAPILVVGAGPVGLSAALALSSLGLTVRLLEAEQKDRIRPGSRALFLHRESLELIKQADKELFTQLVGYGITWSRRCTYYRGKKVYEKSYSSFNHNNSPPFISLRQIDTEKFLLNACEKANVEIIWGAKVQKVLSSDKTVIVESEDGRIWESSYLIAADGAKSTVRKSVGINMNGVRAPGFHVVVDIKEDADNPMPNERIFHYEHELVGRRNVLIVPFAGGWQVDIQCHEADNPDDFSKEESVKHSLQKIIDPKYINRIMWVSKYQFFQLVSDSFIDKNGRVLLCGEAAHLFAPFGARGMNSGIADAFTAAKAVAMAVKDPSFKSIHTEIVKFDNDRRKAAEFNRFAVGKALLHLRAPGRLNKIKRFLAAAFAPYIKRFGLWLEKAPYGPSVDSSSNRKY